MQKIFSQTFSKFRTTENLDIMLGFVEDIVNSIPVFELENVPGEEAAIMSREALLAATEV